MNSVKSKDKLIKRGYQNTPKCFSLNSQSIFVLIKAISFAIYSTSILFATYKVFLACEEHLRKDGEKLKLFQRERDPADLQWMVRAMIAPRLFIWAGIFILFSKLKVYFSRFWNFVSTLLSIVMLWDILGLPLTLLILSQPVIYFFIGQTRSQILVWSISLFFLYNFKSLIKFLPGSSLTAKYYFILSGSWNFARCISFCYDVWQITGEDENRLKIGMKYLWRGIQYCVYFPLVLTGPFVTYKDLENQISEKSASGNDLQKLGKSLLRIALNIILVEVVLRLLHFQSLSLATELHPQLSLWAICGVIFWLGLIFSLKYKVYFGIPTALAEFDGMEMPDLPKCVACIYRYSDLMRNFDRGMYKFLVKYVYAPTVQLLQTVKNIPECVKNLTASLVSFAFVHFWHGLTQKVLIWVVVNFILISIEKIALKRKINKRKELADFLTEPILNLPLTFLYIFNNTFFCGGSLEYGESFARELWERRGFNFIWIAAVLYCLIHVVKAVQKDENPLKLCKQKL